MSSFGDLYRDPQGDAKAIARMARDRAGGRGIVSFVAHQSPAEDAARSALRALAGIEDDDVPEPLEEPLADLVTALEDTAGGPVRGDDGRSLEAALEDAGVALEAAEELPDNVADALADVRDSLQEVETEDAEAAEGDDGETAENRLPPFREVLDHERAEKGRELATNEVTQLVRDYNYAKKIERRLDALREQLELSDDRRDTVRVDGPVDFMDVRSPYDDQ